MGWGGRSARGERGLAATVHRSCKRGPGECFLMQIFAASAADAAWCRTQRCRMHPAPFGSLAPRGARTGRSAVAQRGRAVLHALCMAWETRTTAVALARAKRGQCKTRCRAGEAAEPRSAPCRPPCLAKEVHAGHVPGLHHSHLQQPLRLLDGRHRVGGQVVGEACGGGGGGWGAGGAQAAPTAAWAPGRSELPGVGSGRAPLAAQRPAQRSPAPVASEGGRSVAKLCPAQRGRPAWRAPHRLGR